VVLALPLVAWALYFWLVLPVPQPGGLTRVGLALGVTAFLLGMRHAFDADHITAIDNTTRKLVGESRDASSVGLWFAFGHSTVVIGAVVLISGGVSALIPQIQDDNSFLATVTGTWGPLVSSGFLIVIGAVNLVALARIIRRARSNENTVDTPPPGGLVTMIIRRFAISLDRAWKMYVVGLLFGLGFDTASTIALLLLARGTGITLPWYAALVIPMLFAAGMVLCDGVNGTVVARAYRWTRTGTRRRTYYNATLLGITVAAAFVVALFGLSGVLVDRLGVTVGPLEAIASADLGNFGFLVTAVLVASWAVCYVIWRCRGRQSLRSENAAVWLPPSCRPTSPPPARRTRSRR
jgi:high-affinity nickel-transport protein